MDLIVRQVRSGDAEGLTNILNPIIQEGSLTVLDETFSVEQERDYVSGFPERGVFHVAEDRVTGRILGFQCVEPFATYTHVFDHVGGIGTFIDLSVRRKGIGTRLSDVTFEAAKKKGYEKIFTYVRADNPTSLSFHLKLGFHVVGTAQRQAKIGSRYVDEVFIEKFL